MSDTSRRSRTPLVALVLAAVVWFFACETPLSPERCGTIPDQVIVVGETVNLDLCFHDPNGDQLDFQVFSSDPGVATVLGRGSSVAVTAVYPGTALVTMVATDPTGLKEQQSFWVMVPDRPPNAVGTIDDRELMVGDSAAIDVAGYFSEPDGQALAYTAAGSDSSRLAVSMEGTVVTLVAVAKGTVVVTVTATDPGGLTGTQSFQVKVPNRPPVPVDSIAAREIMVDRADTLDVSPFFSDPDEDPLAYVAAVSDSAVVGATVSGSALTVTGLAKGEAMVTITATDDEGLFATQRFQVTVPNRPPMVTDTIPGRTLFKNEADTLALARYFSDPDGDPLAWGAEASDNGVVALELTGSEGTLVVTARSQGEAVVTVTVTDTEGLTAEQRFQVTVPNRPPMVTDTIPGRTLFKDEADTLALARYFSDPDDDPLTWGAEASDSGVVALGLSGSDGTLTVTALSQGEAVVTVTVTDTEGLTAEQSFAVTVPNRGPVATDTIPAQTIYKRETAPLDLTRYLSDPDGDVLQYEIESTDTLVATAAVTGTTLTVQAGVKGQATLTVTATDPGGLSARQSFAVTVLNRAPTVTTPIPALTIFRRQPHTVDVSAHFSDPDGDTLSYSGVSSARRVVRVRTSGSRVTLSARGRGTADVTVTATDPDSLTVQHTFAVTVGNRGPAPVGSFPDLELGRSDRLTLPINGYFRDPDRDALTYTASTSEPEIARATTRGSSVTLTGVSDGQTTLTLTATDPDGLTATQTSRITVAGQGGNTPAPVATIPEQTIAEGRDRTLAVSGYFRDPNGDPLTYSAATEDPRVATASASGTRVRLTGVASGQTTLTVTATDPGNLSTTLSTLVTVVAQGQGPVAVGPIPEQSVEVGQARTVSMASHFQDPDGASLDFRATSSNPGTVTAAASGSDVTLTGVSEGRAAVTVTATDLDGLSVTQTFFVRVEQEGRAPVTVGDLPGQSIEVGGVAIFDAALYFRDPEGADLNYDAGTSNSSIATASATGSTVTVRGVAAGKTSLTVTATDPTGLSASQSTEVDVSTPPRGPEAVGTIPDESILAGDEIEIDVAPYFRDPNGNTLTYAAGTSNAGIAIVDMLRNTLQVKGVGRGTATITVIASDPNGRTAVQRFSVTVTRIDTGFHIAYAFADNVTAALEDAIRDAGAYWMSILSATEFTDLNLDDTHTCHISGGRFEVDIGYLDDLAIVAAIVDIDGSGGTLAKAGTCIRRVATGDPVLGAMVFDAADIGDLAGSGDLSEVALHETAHILGFGLDSNWDGLLSDSVPGTPGADLHFAGPRAIAAFDAAGGAGYTGGKVPVEGNGVHWRESVLGLELMTPRIRSGVLDPLSAISILALADMGYQVNAGLAESYALASPDAAAAVAEEARTIDLRNDVYRGPVILIGDKGNVVRVVPSEDGGEPPILLRPGEAPARADSAIRITIGSRR